MSRILVTGSEGLVGTAVAAALAARGHGVERLDLRCPAGDPGHGDVRDPERLRERAAGCRGIVHLAAVARVAPAEEDPRLCWETNVAGTGNVLRAAAASPSKPWVLLASSREVYGQPDRLPAREEETPIRPVNVYGRSKAEAERVTLAARNGGGLNTAIVRLANVYGSPDDHPERVVPAFARAAAEGGVLRVYGRGTTLDFTHVDDSALGIVALVEALLAGERGLPPVHLASGRAVSLGELAELAREAGGRRVEVVDAPERNGSVAHFVGDPSRAWELLAWRATIDIADGMKRMVEAFQARARSDRAPG